MEKNLSYRLDNKPSNKLLLKAFTLLLCFIFAPVVSAQKQARQVGGSGVVSGKRYLNAVASRAQFDGLSRTYKIGVNYELPHILFVIDRKDKNKIYYVNAKQYKFHKDFVNGNYLSLERGQEFFDNNYIKANRRFILGTLAYQTPLQKFTFEFWEGDQIPAELIGLTGEIINQTFFTEVAYKPNSLRQEDASASLPNLERVLQSDIAPNQEYLALNTARGIGRIHLIEKFDEHTEIGSNEIVVLKEVPVNLPPVAGIIIDKPSTPLSHINLLAKSWGVPNAYIKGAFEKFKQHDTYWVVFETRLNDYSVNRADRKSLDEATARNNATRALMTPRGNLEIDALKNLRDQRASDVTSYGAKSANLGEVANARLANVVVPDGFTLPFAPFDDFMEANGFNDFLDTLIDNDPKFVHDPAYRRDVLAKLRERIKQGKFDGKLRAEILEKVHREYAGKGLFVRSSTNSEDLPNFNGAGLYDTVPNVKGDDALIDAIKSVWASLWNFEAYEARERAGINHLKVYMGVLIQEGVNADSAGVMITANPFDRRAQNGTVYIAAKRGLGIQVVDGKRVAEQIIYNPRSLSVKVLTRSEEENSLTFDENGGVKLVPVSADRKVLTDEMIRLLVTTGARLKRVFGGKDQDVEWVVKDGKLYVVQSRPYLSGK